MLDELNRRLAGRNVFGFATWLALAVGAVHLGLFVVRVGLIGRIGLLDFASIALLRELGLLALEKPSNMFLSLLGIGLFEAAAAILAAGVVAGLTQVFRLSRITTLRTLIALLLAVEVLSFLSVAIS